MTNRNALYDALRRVHPMTLTSANGKGDFANEFLMLRANVDQNAKFVMLCDTTYVSPGKISNKLRHNFWLPDVDLRKGDYMAVWTRKGTDGMSLLPNGSRVYSHFLQLERAIWNDEQDAAVLLFMQSWKAFPMSDGVLQKRAA